MEYGLIGEKLGHSFSREIHNKIADYSYEPVELTLKELEFFLAEKNFMGVNVTNPYKKKVIPYLDEISEVAAEIGAVNCIKNQGGRLIGHNTDYEGLEALIDRMAIDLKGKKVLILGTGGTSDTAYTLCRNRKAAQIFKVSRNSAGGNLTGISISSNDLKAICLSYEEASAYHNDADIIINTTPCGMFPDLEGCPLDLAPFFNLEAVVDVIYNPLRTRLVLGALERGINACGGLFMLTAQAVKASEFFWGKKYEPWLTEKIYGELYEQKCNRIFTGMPASGKTTMGKLLARQGNLTFFDTDQMIEEEMKMSVKDIFDRHGEKRFRELEAQAVREASSHCGAVIATGGGAVLNKENIISLKQNGEIYFIDKKTEELIPSEDRPLASTEEDIKRIYEERRALYLSSADYVVRKPIHIAKSKAAGRIQAPASKSMAHRFLICSAIAGGISKIFGVEESEDVKATLECLRSMGAKWNAEDGCVNVKGVDLTKITPAGPLNCRESGSTLRFLIPLCLLSGKETEFVGSSRLFERPLDIYSNICKEKGMTFIKDGSTLKVKGPLKAGTYSLDGNVSSQFVSGLLFALPLLNENSKVVINGDVKSRSYIDMTVDALETFGIKVEWQNQNTILIKGNQQYKPQEVRIEGDFSNAAFFEAFNFLGGNVEIGNLNEDSIQGDKVCRELFEKLDGGKAEIDISDCPDLGPILFALAAAKEGGVFSGIERLRFKESDRVKSMAAELKKFGIDLKEEKDKVIIEGGELRGPDRILSGHNDHRVVMALSVLLTLTGGVIEGTDAVNKSFPRFFEELTSLGVDVKPI